MRVVERRDRLPQRHALLIGENRTESYEALQNRIGELLHGADDWRTIVVPRPLAKTGAWLEEKIAPVIPEDFEKGQMPFIRPFMVELASDHYDLDTSQAGELLGWRPQHYIYDGLEKITATLKDDPAEWYGANGISPPHWVDAAAGRGQNPDRPAGENAARPQFTPVQERAGMFSILIRVDRGKVWNAGGHPIIRGPIAGACHDPSSNIADVRLRHSRRQAIHRDPA